MHEATSAMKCFEEFENEKPYTYENVKKIQRANIPVHVLLNTSMIDEKWIYLTKTHLIKQDIDIINVK